MISSIIQGNRVHNELRDLQQAFHRDILEVRHTKELDLLRNKYLGKRGPIQDLMRNLRTTSPDERPKLGKALNKLKQEISTVINCTYQTLKKTEVSLRLSREKEDISLPGRAPFMGRKHPITQMLDEATEILIGMGFSMQYSPEIESEYYNYEGLNYPPDHPARDMQDTFYISSDILLRSHTTSIQQHIMEKSSPPIRIFSAGKCYRNETVSARSHVFFHQMDVLYIDKRVSLSNLLSAQEEFYTKLFHEKIEMRVRPSYFPFVEPGMETDIRCTQCKGNGCYLCKHTGWLEVCGAGIVHPDVLQKGGVDSEIYSGYAWGTGIDRLCMLLHQITDIRLFFENDMRFLSQFP